MKTPTSPRLAALLLALSLAGCKKDPPPALPPTTAPAPAPVADPAPTAVDAPAPDYLPNPPEAVWGALGAVEAELEEGNTAQMCKRVGPAKEALLGWLAKLPSGRNAAVLSEEVAASLDDFMAACPKIEPEQARKFLRRVKRDIEVKVKPPPPLKPR